MIVDYLTDTHCHLNLNTFVDDLPAVVDRAVAQGVQRILVPGIDVPTSRIALQLAERFPILYAAVGVHPGDASTWTPDTLTQLAELADHPKTLAIGEIGLDYYRDHAPRDQQKLIFQAQLDLAAKKNLPVILHNRDAAEDLWSILGTWVDTLHAHDSPRAQLPGVLHSYDGDLPFALQAVEKGFFIGVSGPVTFKNAGGRQQVVAGLPLEKILVETDAPYLAPHPHRGKWPNEPAFTCFIVNKIADLHNQTVDFVRKATATNAARLFAWES